MRLTTLARMRLDPGGTVHRYDVRATDLPGAAPRAASFDQERHLGLGPRPGSWMALAFRLPFPASHATLAAAWHRVIDRHGTLRTRALPAPADDAGRPRLLDVAIAAGRWSTAPAAGGEDARQTLRRVLDSACDPFAAPSHVLCLVEPPEDSAARPTVVLGLDHAHVDAWSLLVLLRDLTAALDAVASGAPPSAEGAAAFAEHTAHLAALAPAPREVRERWDAIMRAGGGEMPVFPLPLGDVSAPREEIVETRDVLDAAGVERLESAAAGHGVRMLALATAEMTSAFRALGAPRLRAVFPVHSRHDGRWDDSVGWFITNSVLETESDEPAACAAAVREAVRLGGYPLAPLLAPWGGMPHTPGMFAVSWLDNRRLPVDVDHSLDPQHVSAPIRTTGVMAWFVVNPLEGLRIRCRHPDTPEAREHVSAWLDLLCAGLARRAAAPIRA